MSASTTTTTAAATTGSTKVTNHTLGIRVMGQKLIDNILNVDAGKVTLRDLFHMVIAVTTFVRINFIQGFSLKDGVSVVDDNLFDGRQFWQPIKKVMKGIKSKKTDGFDQSWIYPSGSTSTSYGFIGDISPSVQAAIMTLQHYVFSPDPNAKTAVKTKVNQDVHYLQKIVEIVTLDDPSAVKVLQLALNLGQLQASINVKSPRIPRNTYSALVIEGNSFSMPSTQFSDYVVMDPDSGFLPTASVQSILDYLVSEIECSIYVAVNRILLESLFDIQTQTHTQG